MLPKLNECDTDDDVAMRFLRNTEGFEKYLQYLVGQTQAESAISDKAVHSFFKVNVDLLNVPDVSGLSLQMMVLVLHCSVTHEGRCHSYSGSMLGLECLFSVSLSPSLPLILSLCPSLPLSVSLTLSFSLCLFVFLPLSLLLSPSPSLCVSLSL